MKLLILCPQWGHEHLPLEDFFSKVKKAGYDGIDTWVSEDINERKKTHLSFAPGHLQKFKFEIYDRKNLKKLIYCY